MVVIKDEGFVIYSPLVLPEASTLGGVAPESSMPASAPARLEITFDRNGAGSAAQTAARPADCEQAGEDAADILEKARAQAAKIIADAEARAAGIERAARESAVQEARSLIAAEADAELEPLRAQLAGSLDDAALLREQVAAYAEQEMVQLAIEIARKIVRREVTVDREIVISLARVAIARLHNRALAIVHLHPDDYQYVLSHRERLGTTTSVKLIEDPSIGRGGCLIETEFGDVDARIEQQFTEIERGFLHELEA